MAVSYTYVTTDLLSNAILGELNMTGESLSFDVQINQPGNMSGTVQLNDPMMSNEDILARTTPGKTAFWAYRENQIVWAGIIWSRQYDSSTLGVQLTGQTFESYAARRFPRSAIGTTTQNFNQGQSSIIDTLWAQLQGVKYGNIGVSPAGQYPLNDVTRQIAVNGWDLSQTYDDVIQSICSFPDGPDYTIIWAEDETGSPRKQLYLGLPLGRKIADTQLVIDYPGQVMDYQYIENASGGNNQWWAVGDGTQAAAPVGIATDQNSLSSGWPLLEGVDDATGVTDLPTLTRYANADLTLKAMPMVTHAVDLAGEGFPQFGSYGLGDYTQTTIVDPRFPEGRAFTKRVIGWTIVPPDTGAGVETITLIYDEPASTG